MSTLNLSKTIETPAGLRCTATATVNTGCVSVEVRSIFSSTGVNILWSEIEDMEALARIFADERVIVFQAIVEMLGKIHSNRHIYEALL